MTDTSAPAAATPASSDTPIVSDLSRLARVLFSPTAVFTEIQDRPRFWGPFAIVAVLTIIINYFNRPFQRRIGELISEHLNRPVPADTPVKMVLGFVTAPIGLLIICAISALIFYALVAAMGGDTSFKKMLSVVIHTFPIVLMVQVISVIVLHQRGIASINGPSDLMVSLGADLLLPDSVSGFFPRIFLAQIGPLQIWGVIIAAMGAKVMGKLTSGSAWAAAIIHFLIFATALSALGAFGMGMAQKALAS
jgi:hypothetical protein